MFGDLLRHHRLAAGLTQETLAERAGISPSGIAALERGRRTAPRPDTVVLLADALQLAPAERARFIAAATAVEASLSDAESSAPAHLPIPPTMLVGREHEEAAIVHLLDRGARLLTLTGPGGVGKTHLALQVARAVQNSHAGSVAFVDLSAVREPTLVAATVAHALGLAETGAQHGRDLLVEHLQAQRLLLVLDNFEQVVDAASLVGDVIEACPHLTLLITSRAPLRLRVEQRFPVAPLSIPGPELTALQELIGYGAVRLFVTRAQAVQPGFALTEANAPAVAAICRRLDGLPLAIELAAACVRLLPPGMLLSRLDQRLSMLAAAPRDLPVRQQTLRSVIAWSYDLLDEAERRFFRQVAIFVGGLTLEAAEAVCRAGTEQGAPVEADGYALDSVGSLLEKNLLRSAESADGAPRFAMLETIRDYALEQLDASGEMPAVQERHATFFLALAEAADPHLRSGDRNVWLERLHRDSDNLRAALAWSGAEPSGAPLGLRLAAALTWFWRFYEWLHEGRSWLEAMLARTEGADATTARGTALYGAGMLAWYQGDLPTASTRTEQSVALFRALGDTEGLATAQRLLGLIRLGQGDPAAARIILEESRALFHEGGNMWGEAMTLYRLGLAAAQMGDPAARVCYERSLALFRQVGDTLGVAVVLNALGVAAIAQGDDATALAIIEESLPLARQATDRWDLARLLINAGTLWLRRGDDRQARDLFAESLRLWQDIGHMAGIALSLAGLGAVAAARGQAERAGQLFGVARQVCPTTDPFVTAASGADLDRRIDAARAGLDTAAFDVGWVAGRALSLDEVIAAALRD